MNGLQIDPVIGAAHGADSPLLIDPLAAVRWIAFGTTAIPDAMPRPWTECALDVLLAERAERDERLSNAEILVRRNIAAGRLRCAYVPPLAECAGKPPILHVLSPDQLKGADVQEHWNEGGLILSIKLEGEEGRRKTTDFMLFWSEVDSLRSECMRAERPESEWEKEEELSRRAYIASRDLIAPPRANGPGSSRRLYAPLILEFADELRKLGRERTIKLKQESLFSDMFKLTRQVSGSEDGYSKTIKAEAIAVRDYLIKQDKWDS